jgi:glucosamine kinase
VHNKQWAAEFVAANPGYAAIRLETDGFTTLMGAHGGAPGAIVAIGTGSVGEVLREDGSRHEVGGWGFPAGDEASGAWIGLRAIGHIEQVLDGRRERSAFADSIIEACGGSNKRDAIQVWLGKATQTAYASLAPLVLRHAATDPVARAILLDAGSEVAAIAHALDPQGTLPLALCGGLGAALRDFLPPGLLARTTAPQGDSAAGALRMIALHISRTANERQHPHPRRLDPRRIRLPAANRTPSPPSTARPPIRQATATTTSCPASSTCTCTAAPGAT